MRVLHAAAADPTCSWGGSGGSQRHAAGAAAAEPPHARARELIATLKKQSAQKAAETSSGGGGGGWGVHTGRGAATPRRMAAVKNVEEVKTPRGGNTQTLYTI